MGLLGWGGRPSQAEEVDTAGLQRIEPGHRLLSYLIIFCKIYSATEGINMEFITLSGKREQEERERIWGTACGGGEKAGCLQPQPLRRCVPVLEDLRGGDPFIFGDSCWQFSKGHGRRPVPSPNLQQSLLWIHGARTSKAGFGHWVKPERKQTTL